MRFTYNKNIITKLFKIQNDLLFKTRVPCKGEKPLYGVIVMIQHDVGSVMRNLMTEKEENTHRDESSERLKIITSFEVFPAKSFNKT